MSYQKCWIENRSRIKIEKTISLDHLLNKVKDTEDKAKLEQLISVYLDAHDFVTQVGLEIAKYSDKYPIKKK